MIMKNDTIIVDDYVSKELAVLLEDRGFSQFTEYVYFIDKDCTNFTTRNNITLDEYFTKDSKCISAPTLNIARKYIREKYNVEFNVRCVAVGSLTDRLDGNVSYVVDIADLESQTWVENNIMEDSYKDALNKAMLFILNKLKTNN